MALHKTEAVVLKAFNWSESSRTVRLFTRDFGRLALIDKGGRQLASKRGRLVPFARMEITFYKSQKATGAYISDAELLELFSFEREGTMGRLAYASAACELVQGLLDDEQPQPELYALFVTFLKLTEAAARQSLPPMFLSFFLHLLSLLGYDPIVDRCGGCGRSLDEMTAAADEVSFSPERGGLICPSCQTAGEQYIPLSCRSARYLPEVRRSSLSDAAAMPIGYVETTRLVEALLKFVGYQTGAVSKLKSLDFLEKLRNGPGQSPKETGSNESEEK